MGFWLFSGYAFQTVGLLYTTSSKAGFITGLSVVLVPLFSFLFLKQKPFVNASIGAVLAAVGLYFLTIGDGKWMLNRGDVFVFFCAISFAMHIITTGKYSARYSTMLLTMTQIFTVAVMCTIFAFLFEDETQMWNVAILQKREVWTALLITSLFATTAAFFNSNQLSKIYDSYPRRSYFCDGACICRADRIHMGERTANGFRNYRLHRHFVRNDFRGASHYCSKNGGVQNGG